jgi:opacity protein-like surface antigen
MLKLNRLALVLLAGSALSSLSLANSIYYPHGFFVQLNGNYSFLSADMSAGAANSTTSSSPTIAKGKQNNHQASFGGELGYAFNQYPFAFGLEYNHYQDFNYNRSPIYTADSVPFTNYNLRTHTSAQTVLANVQIDIHGLQYVVPYVEVGAGETYFDPEGKATATSSSHPGTYTVTGSTWRLAWQAGVGVKFAVTSHIMLGLHYHYVDLGTIHLRWAGTEDGVKTPNKLNGTLTSNNVGLDVAYYFGAGTQPLPSLLDDDA